MNCAFCFVKNVLYLVSDFSYLLCIIELYLYYIYIYCILNLFDHYICNSSDCYKSFTWNLTKTYFLNHLKPQKFKSSKLISNELWTQYSLIHSQRK